MSRVSVDSLDLPFSGVTPISRHCSWLGAQAAKKRAARQIEALLAAYQTHGPLTDVEAAQVLKVERTTICARRNELVEQGKVQPVGSKKNPLTGVRNAVWGIA